MVSTSDLHSRKFAKVQNTDICWKKETAVALYLVILLISERYFCLKLSKCFVIHVVYY